MINMIEELKRLVSIRSEVWVEGGEVVRRNYDKAANAVAELAERAGLDVTIEYVKTPTGDEIPTVLATARGAGPTIALVSHYDVVPAKEPWDVDGRQLDPYEPVIVDGRLYGRGAADDKSAIVASIAALGELVAKGAELKYKPTIVVTGDEEVGGLGIRGLLDAGFKWDKAVIVDAGASYLTIGASGVIHAWLKVKGKAGHAGYAHLADNPVEKLALLITEMVREYKALRGSKISELPAPPGSPLPKLWGRASFTILKLGAGEAEKHNKIPGEAVAGLDVRLIPEEDVEEALEELYAVFGRITSSLGIRATLEIVSAQRGWKATDLDLVRDAENALKKAYAELGVRAPVVKAAEFGGNDGTFFYLKGIPVIAYGAIREDNNIHAPNEFVYIRDLDLLKSFVTHLLSKPT